MTTKMPRAIVDLDEFVESNNLMVYGDTGSGKTELVAQLPGKVLVVASENGTIVIRKALARLGLTKAQITKEMKRFKVWRIRAWSDLEECYEWCRDNQGVFDWIAIDSATSLDQRAMRAAMEAAVKRNPERRDIDLPDKGEHQKRQNAMKRMITDFNELSTNVLWLAQAMRREDRDGNEIVVPFITGKDYEVSAFACAQMQAFGFYMKKASKRAKGQTDRILIWESFADKDSDINYWSKDRYDVFPKVCRMVTAGQQTMTFGELLDLITPEALSKATARVDQRDDDLEVPDDDEETPDGYDDETPDSADDDDTDPDDEDDDDDTDEDDEDSVDDEEDDEPLDTADMIDARESELLAMKPMDLKKAVEAVGLTVAQFKGVPKEDIVAAVLEREFTDGTEEDEDSDDEDLDLDEMMDDDEPEDEDEEADSADDEPARPARSGRPVKAAAKKTTTRPAARPTTTTKKTAKPVRRMRAV